MRRDQRGNMLGLCTTQDVAFAHPFEAQPRVVVWLTGVEMMKTRVWRVRVSARAIRNSGFEIAVEKWGDALLYAYPAMQKGVCSGTFETLIQLRLFADHTVDRSRLRVEYIFN